MNVSNEIIKTALNYALGALFHLDDAGVGVIDIAVRGGRAIVTIDRAPPTVQGAQTVARTVGGLREVVCAAPYFGVQLEWSDFTPVPPRRIAAGGVA